MDGSPTPFSDLKRVKGLTLQRKMVVTTMHRAVAGTSDWKESN